jgi:hypothetical protein
LYIRETTQIWGKGGRGEGLVQIWMVQTNQVHAAVKIVKENRDYLLLGGGKKVFLAVV